MPSLDPAAQSERIRPRPGPCLAGSAGATPTALAARAADELDAGAHDRALACADEALRLAPRLVAALAARADALAELGRHEQARVAYARALAVDADDPVALLGAAELYVRRLVSDHEGLSLGLEYARRGLREAARREPRDAALVARLELVAGMAENDLGRSRLALAHPERSLLEVPEDPDAIYEKGVALYELCRFEDARRALEKALLLAPDDAWTLHQLGLVLERTGGHARAVELFARARALAPTDFHPEVPVDGVWFDTEVKAVLAALPPAEQRALAAVPLEIVDLPAADDLLAVDPPLSPSILGLFRGPPENEPCTNADGPRCRSIVIYRRNLVRFARDRGELTDQVRVTLLHELGHLHGESDDELRARGLD
jgi:tetratricopeptide (TPR) repeat protein